MGGLILVIGRNGLGLFSLRVEKGCRREGWVGFFGGEVG
jgi:hypothetical protein